MECSLEDMQLLLYKVTKPYQYAGGEYLSSNKNFDEAAVKLLLAFPDKYEIGISNLGHKILYSRVNSYKEFAADRVYAPEEDFRQLLSQKGISLFSIENRRTPKEFDIIGFSLQYEPSYPAVLEMLRLSHIPVLRKERTEEYPLIIAGGPCCFNPKPVQNFIDLFMIGDGEELIIDVMSRYKELKHQDLERSEIIKELSNIEGVYAPEFPKKTRKRIFDISKDAAPKYAPVPFSACIHDRTVTELRRGCGRMCRFCQAGHITLPVRERRAEDVIKIVKDELKTAGYNEYSLLSLSSNDYSNIESVIEELNCEMKPKRISVSLPSQRIDRYSSRLAELTGSVRRTAVTLAPEAGSQRLRNVINKNLTEDQIIETVLNCYKSGASHIKLYFIIGLPFETYEDIDETIELLRKIKYRSKLMKQELELKDPLNITCSVSIFVPKPFTPFQWAPQNPQQEIREKIKYLLEKTKSIKGVTINYHSSYMSKVECALARGDEKYNDFILALHKKGVYLAAWDEYMDKNLWEETAHECGFDIDEEAQREYSLDKELPWDIIDAGLDKEWLKKQYKNAQSAAAIIPCEFSCADCGVCRNLNTHKILDKPYKAKISCIKNDEEKQPYKYRIKLTKQNELRYISHLDWQNTIIKMLFRSGLQLSFSKGFNPSPEFSLGIALPLYAESMCELIDIKIFDDISSDELVKKLNNVLPKNMRAVSAAKIDKTVLPIDIEAQWAQYAFELLTPETGQGILKNQNLLYIKDKISSSKEMIIEKVNKKGVKKLVDIRRSVKSAEVFEDKLYMILKTGQNEEIPSVKPLEAVKFYAPDLNFRIIRTAFFDKDMNRL